ncbi:MAG: hypothetical protein V1934_06695 [Methanobacteriota archaeon]
MARLSVGIMSAWMALLVVLSGISGIATTWGGGDGAFGPHVDTEWQTGHSSIDDALGEPTGAAGETFQKMTRVVVVTTDVGELTSFLSKYKYEGLIGSKTSSRKGVAFPILTLPKEIISDLESKPYILGVYPYSEGTETGIKSAERADAAGEPTDDSLSAGQMDEIMRFLGAPYYQGAEDAWALGYSGDGVNVAVVTGGVDFGHEDLMGRYATSGSGDYAGWPIAFDGSSLSAYIADGPQSGTETPNGDSWYVNTSSTDMRILHTVIVDGTNDFWVEMNTHKTANQTYDLNETTEVRGRDPTNDVSPSEFDLGSSYVAQDANKWFLGFDVTKSSELAPRVKNVRYGIYIDTDGGASTSGATIDPMGNKVETNSTNRPEYAIYMTHYGEYWGVKGTIVRWVKGAGGDWGTYQTNVDWGVDGNTGKWNRNNTFRIDSTGVTIDYWEVQSDLQVWSKNDTVLKSSVRVFGWNGTAWNYTSLLTDTVNKTGFKGEFTMKSGFVEMSIPRASLRNANTLSMAVMSFGLNVSRPQDSIPKEFPKVFNATPDWGKAIVTLTNYTVVGVPHSYVTAGIPSAGGKMRIGLHPDQNLITYHYGRPVAVLLTDSLVANVYDSVYVDLDNDKNFSDERPMQRYGAYNAALMIGPQWGTVRYSNNTLLHNNTWYDIKNVVTEVLWSNETLKQSAVGGETVFYVGNESANAATLVVNRPASHAVKFDNSSVYTCDGTETAPFDFPLGNSDIVEVGNISMEIPSTEPNAGWYNLNYSHFSINNATGVATFKGHPSLVNDWNNQSSGPVYTHNIPINGTDTVNFYLPYSPVVSWLLLEDGSSTLACYEETVLGGWFPLDYSNGDFTIDNATGLVSISPFDDGEPGELVPAGMVVYMNFSYSVDPVSGTEFSADYRYTQPVNPAYTFDPITRKLELAEGLVAGDTLSVMYSYNVVNPAAASDRYGLIYYNGQNRTVELREWAASKDIDADGGKGDGKAFPDLSGGMAYFISRASEVSNEALTLLENGTYAILGHTNIVNNSWTVRVNSSVYGLDKVKVNTETGRMDFSPALWPTSTVFVDYDYDGLAIPYSQAYCERNGGIDNVIPANGDMVALTGSFDLDYSQGTEIATAIVGGGVSVDGNGESLLKGMAPNARLISIRADPFSAWYFAVEGYDGNVTTINDQAQIVAITSVYGLNGDGFDIYSRAVDYISTVYAAGRTVFLAGTGDAGHGYGTINSPASSPGVISVGQGTNFAYRNYKPKAPDSLARAYADGGPNARQGNVLPSSGRGPSMLGYPEPDVISTGAFLFVGTPLNGDQDATSPMDLQWEGGQWAWDLVSGSWLAGSTAVGATALVMQAYKEAHGTFPTISMVRRILASSADNLNYDPLSQGAGMVNALRGVKMASDKDGILMDTTFWTPGEYRGTTYDAFVHLMKPGQNATKNVNLTNVNPTLASNVKVYDAVFMKFDSLDFDINITKNYDDDRVPGLINIEPLVPRGTELLRASVFSHASASGMKSYMAEFFDWTDTNDNGKMDFTGEQNRVTYSIGTNAMEIRLRDPLGAYHDGIGLQIKDFGGDGTVLNDWHVQLAFYTQVDWSWLSLQSTPSSIDAGKYDIYGMTLAVPAGTPMGSYEGAVYTIEQMPTENDIAVGVGTYVKSDSFWDVSEGIPNPDERYGTWFTPRYARVDNLTVRGGEVSIVEGSTTVYWNGSALNEGTDYSIAPGGEIMFFYDIPLGAQPFFNISYLVLEIDPATGNTIENPATSAKLNMGNLKKGNYTVYKNGAEFQENNPVSEVVMTSLGGETKVNLDYGGVTRQSATVFLNGTAMPQEGGSVVDEAVVSPALGGETYANLSRGALVPGSATIVKNGDVLPQTDEISMYDKEQVVGLKATVTTVTDEALALGAPNMAKSIWYESGSWYGLLNINSYYADNYKIISYNMYANGVSLTDGVNVTMNIANGTGVTIYGLFRLNPVGLDPFNDTFKVTYKYYDMTLKGGFLEHRNIVPESYSIYLSGAEMKTGTFQLNLDTGALNLSDALGPEDYIEAVYKYITYTLDAKTGVLELSDALEAGDTIDVSYEYQNYTVDLVRGIIYFSTPLKYNVNVSVDYSYVQYTVDAIEGIIKFSKPLMPGESVSCGYWHYLNVLPILVNIGVDGPNFNIGGGGETGLLFGPNEVTSGFGSGEGDRRFYYFDVLEQGYMETTNPNYKLFTELKWDNNLTDVNVQVFGGRQSLQEIPGMGSDTFSSARYGPHGISRVGTSDETAGFFTTTNGPGETIALPYSSGLNVLALNTVGLSGDAPTELFTGTVGTMYIDQPAVSVETNKLIGGTSLYMHSSVPWDGIGGFASGPSAPKEYRNMTVTQDDPNWANYVSFEEQLSSGGTTVAVELKDCLIFQVHLMGQVDFGYKDVVDLDLGIFLDGSNDQPKDGKTQVEEFVAMDADGDADETVKLIKPVDGTYLIRPFGFTLKLDPAHFDLDITIVQGKGFAVSGGMTDVIPAFTPTDIGLSWVLPGDTKEGKLLGAMYMGPADAQMCLLVPIEIEYDVTPPSVSGITPADGTYTTDRTPLISTSFIDPILGKIDPDSIDLKIDGESMRASAIINANYGAMSSDVSTLGYWTATISLTPQVDLPDGGHSIQVSVSDKAGNVETVDWVITVDTQAPELQIASPPSDIYVSDLGGVTVNGSATPGSDILAFNGANEVKTSLDANGEFGFAVTDLVDGANEIKVRATDAAGNMVEVVRRIYLDTTTPRIISIASESGSLTNRPSTRFTGKVDKAGQMALNGIPIAVFPDGTFEHIALLTEGVNVFEFQFTDLAGTVVKAWKNVTKDTIAPEIWITESQARSTNGTYVLAGTTDADSSVGVNGKPVVLDADGGFVKNIDLSYGINTIVVTSKDTAGNIAENRVIVYYDIGPGLDLGGMLCITVIAMWFVVWLLVGIWVYKDARSRGMSGALWMLIVLFLGLLGIILYMIIRKKHPKIPQEPPVTPPEADAQSPEASPEPVEQEVAGPSEGELLPMPPVVEEPAVPEAPLDEPMPEAPTAEPAALEPEAPKPAEPIAATEPIEEMDPLKAERIAKLDKALADGKISKELYEKNMARIKSQ